MYRLVVALGLILAGGAADALEMPFAVGPISCRAEAGIKAEIPGCSFDLATPDKAATCTINAHTDNSRVRHLVQASASPVSWRDISRGPSPFVFNHKGITCWLHIPDYVSGYRCTKHGSGFDCTACLKGTCYTGRVTIREVSAE